MKAAYRDTYGPPSILKVKEVEKPRLKDNEVLVKVMATTVNRTDYGVLSANYFAMRFFTGLINPTRKITGTDFAGIIESVGKDVIKFKKGDKVFGFNDNGSSSHAEYLAIPANNNILEMPAGFTFEQAAASAEGFHYALNFINKVKLQKGQKVMVNGGTGAIGSAAIQLLKYMDLYVAATCKTQHKDIVKNLGADKVIDYIANDFTEDDEKYDFVFDTVGKSSFGECKKIMKEKSAYISSELGPGVENLYLPLVTKIKGGKKVFFPFPVDIKKSLQTVRQLAEEGKFKPLIDKKYPLDQIREAFEYVITGEKVGNVIIEMEHKE